MLQAIMAPRPGEIRVLPAPDKEVASTPQVRVRMAARIVRLRTHCGLSQSEVGAKMQLSDAAVSMWEKAKTEPSLDKIVKLARILGTTPEYIAFGITASSVEEGS